MENEIKNPEIRFYVGDIIKINGKTFIVHNANGNPNQIKGFELKCVEEKSENLSCEIFTEVSNFKYYAK